MPHFYLYLNDEQVGPYSAEELATYLDQGELTDDVPARAEDATAWSTLGEVRDQFFPHAAPAYQPPPPPPDGSPAADDDYLPPALNDILPVAARPGKLQAEPTARLEASSSPQASRGSRLPYYLAGALLLLACVAAGVFTYRSHFPRLLALLGAPTAKPAAASIAPVPTVAVLPPARPDDAAVRQAIAANVPPYLELTSVKTLPPKATSYRFSAGYTSKENLYTAASIPPDLSNLPTVPNPPSPPLPLEQLYLVSHPGDPLFNDGQFVAEKIDGAWKISQVEFQVDWKKLGQPRDTFVHDPAILFEMGKDDLRMLSDWSKQVAAYRQTILNLKTPPPTEVITPAVAPVAGAPETPVAIAAPSTGPAGNSASPVTSIPNLPANSTPTSSPTSPPSFLITPTPVTEQPPPPPAASEAPPAPAEPAPPSPPVVTASTVPPPVVTAPDFVADDLIVNCTTPDSAGNSVRFNNLFRNHTYTFTGTVARLNRNEGLVVFHGGGSYPHNWDLQVTSSNLAAYPIGREITVRFRLTKMIVVPFVGISFRGDHLHRSSHSTPNL